MIDDIRRAMIAILRQFSPWIQGADDVFPMDCEIREIGIDSMTVLTLIFELENSFGITFDDAFLTYDVFRTPATIENAVRALMRD